MGSQGSIRAKPMSMSNKSVHSSFDFREDLIKYKNWGMVYFNFTSQYFIVMTYELIRNNQPVFENR